MCLSLDKERPRNKAEQKTELRAYEQRQREQGKNYTKVVRGGSFEKSPGTDGSYMV